MQNAIEVKSLTYDHSDLAAHKGAETDAEFIARAVDEADVTGCDVVQAKLVTLVQTWRASGSESDDDFKERFRLALMTDAGL